jgi:hypothetical protein
MGRALCTSSMTYRPDGFRSAMNGTLSDTRWKSSILSSTPACSGAAQNHLCSVLRGCGLWRLVLVSCEMPAGMLLLMGQS